MSAYTEKLPIELQRIIASGKIPNTLLFTGNEGTGRSRAARLFAKTLNCRGHAEGETVANPCNQCSSCKKMASGLHPDIIVVSPEKDRIRIPQIREMCSLISVKPHEAKWRLVLIERADTLGAEASNALLKTLEEPPRRTVFILLASTVATLLPTILSRCSLFRFHPLPPEEICRQLVDIHGVDPQLARVAVAWSDGNTEKALIYANATAEAQQTNWIKRRHWLIQEISRLIQAGKHNEPGCFFAFPLAEILSRESDLLPDSLAILRTWIRDLAVIDSCPERIINIDFRDLLSSVAEGLNLDRLVSWMKEIHEAETGLRLNTAPRTTLEHLFLKLAGAHV